jgi:hypothetical protein
MQGSYLVGLPACLNETLTSQFDGEDSEEGRVGVGGATFDELRMVAPNK